MINKFAILIFKLFLYPWVYLKRFFVRLRPESIEGYSLLLVNTTGIGDTILSTPAWQALRERFPDARISLMVHQRRRDVVSHNPFVDNIITYRKFVYFPRLIRKLCSLHIDKAIIFHGNDPDILPLVFLGGAKEIIGYQKRTKLPYFLTTALKELPDHFITAQMKLAEAAGGDMEAGPTGFFLTHEEREQAKLFLEQNKINSPFTIGILPGAGRAYKRWPPDRFAAVITHMLQKFNTDVIIFGSKKERALAQKVEDLSIKHAKSRHDGKLINTAGSLNLRESAALMEKLNLFITNDSGPLHIVMALGIPTVALFCPSDPGGLLSPAKNHVLKVIKKHPPCKPCITKRCKHPFCMEQISAEEVIKASENFT